MNIISGLILIGRRCVRMAVGMLAFRNRNYDLISIIIVYTLLIPY
jgi:hypothetical protein